MNGAAQRRSIGRVLDVLSEPGDALPMTDLAPRAARLLDAAGAGVTVGGDPRGGGVLVALSTTGLGEIGEELQSMLGEGPAYTVHRSGRPISVPCLAGDTTWVMFGHEAARDGIAGVFAFPLREARTTLGALTLYRRQARDLTADQRDDATTLAALIGGYLARHHGARNDPALLAGEPQIGAINQATGMVSVQLGLDMPAALAVLRARALRTERTLPAVAREVVAGHLQLADPER